jgi:hypothetical protein
MAQPHDPIWRGGVPLLIGGPRFQTYLSATTAPDEAIRLYSWNIEVSASLWGGFHLAEVCLRNALNDRLVDHFGTRAWWDSAQLHNADLSENCATESPTTSRSSTETSPTITNCCCRSSAI